jgi:hypothetical protein
MRTLARGGRLIRFSPTSRSRVCCPQQSPSTVFLATFERVRTMLPREILLSILYRLEGDSQTILHLALTCKLFRALLTENEPRIASEIALNHSPSLTRFLLEATAPTIRRPCFRWLSHAYTRGHAIELLTNALENAGLYQNQSVFGSIFSIYGRPLVAEDHVDVRRYVLTMLLAVELCSVSNETGRHKLIWVTFGPRWTAGLALHTEDLLRHLVKMLYLSIEEHNRETWGPSDAPSGFFPDREQAERLTSYLFSGMLLTGARGIVDILSTTYKTYDQFVAVARERLYGGYLERYRVDELWPQQRLPGSLWFLNALKNRRDQERFSKATTDNPGAVYKDYIDKIAIDEWKSDIPNEEAWIRFVHSNGWSNPLQFRPAQLRRTLPRSIFRPPPDKNGRHQGWRTNDAQRIMRQPIAT